MNEMKMVYAGQGDIGEFGGESGDLIIVFNVQESDLFQRSGDDVLSEVNISFFEAALGATVIISGIYENEIPLKCVTACCREMSYTNVLTNFCCKYVTT